MNNRPSVQAQAAFSSPSGQGARLPAWLPLNKHIYCGRHRGPRLAAGARGPPSHPPGPGEGTPAPASPARPLPAGPARHARGGGLSVPLGGAPPEPVTTHRQPASCQARPVGGRGGRALDSPAPLPDSVSTAGRWEAPLQGPRTLCPVSPPELFRERQAAGGRPRPLAPHRDTLRGGASLFGALRFDQHRGPQKCHPPPAPIPSAWVPRPPPQVSRWCV